MEEKFYVTEEGLNDLKKELDTLIHVTRDLKPPELRVTYQKMLIMMLPEIIRLKLNPELKNWNIR